MSGKDDEAAELEHAEEVGFLIFPAADESAEVVEPSEEALDFPAAAVTTQFAGRPGCSFDGDCACGRRVLNKFGVPVEFHAQRFWTRDGSGRRVDEYHDWSDEKAGAYVNALLAAVKKHDLYMLGSVMPVDLFYKYSEDDRRYLTGAKVEGGQFTTTGKPTAPYFLPFQHCFIEAAQRFERSPQVHYLFDQNEQLSGWATALYQDLRTLLKVSDRLGELKYADSRTSAPLQAADLVCFELKECVEKSKDVMKLEASYVLKHATRRGAQVKIFDERVIMEILPRTASLDQDEPVHRAERG